MVEPAGERPPRLALYSRQYCHLCHDMLIALQALRGELAFEIAVVDVEADPALARRFNELVPVLMHGDREIARFRLDADALRAYIAEIG